MKSIIRFAISLAVLFGIANASRADLLDVYASTFPGGNPTLETVNLATGQATTLGTVNWGGLINDIAQDPITGTLYGLSGSSLFTISTAGQIGAVTPVTAAGMSGSMETLAFNNQGDLYIGTQSSLYKMNFTNPNKLTGTATYIGSYDANGGDPYLNGAGQNMRFNGSTLYLANTGSGNNTELYTVNTGSGAANLVGVITNQPSIVLGNNGGHMYGSSVPAINGGNAAADLLDFGSTVTTYLAPNPLGGSGQLPVVNYTTLKTGANDSSFPLNVNFTAASNVAAVPEPGIGILLSLGLVGLIVVRRYQQQKEAIVVVS